MSLSKDTGDGPPQWVPQVTASSVYAMCFTDGVVLAADSGVSYGRMARFKNVSRIFRVNSRCVLAFSGDWGDFQHVTIKVEDAQERHYHADPGLELTPKMVHSLLADYLYHRRSKLDPIWDTVVVAGLEPKPWQGGDPSTFSKFGREPAASASEQDPFLGVVSLRGSAYGVKSLATGFGSFLANQMLEAEWTGTKGQLSCDAATDAIREALKTAYSRDCDAARHFNTAFVKELVDTAGGGPGTSAIVCREPKSLDAKWDISERGGNFE